MYLTRDEQGFDVATLRQGDILQGVPFPLLDQTKLPVLGEIALQTEFNSVPSLTTVLHEHRGDVEWSTAIAPVRFGFCAVITNCCDLEPRQGKVRLPAVALARLIRIPADIRQDTTRFESLRANKDPRDQNNAGYIDFFYLKQHPLLQNEDWRVHFAQVTSLPLTDITLLLAKKILQLDDRTRMKFKIKLGFTYFRPNVEELAAGLANPWQEPPQNHAQANATGPEEA